MRGSAERRASPSANTSLAGRNGRRCMRGVALNAEPINQTPIGQLGEECGGGADAGVEAADLHVLVRGVVALVGVGVGHQERGQAERLGQDRVRQAAAEERHIDRALSRTRAPPPAAPARPTGARAACTDGSMLPADAPRRPARAARRAPGTWRRCRPRADRGPAACPSSPSPSRGCTVLVPGPP